MNPLEIIQNISETNTVLLLLALVAVFVVAFKVLEMVFQTVLVAALSGGFYLALAYFLTSVAFSLESLIFFTFIGGTLYTVYHLFLRTFRVASISAKLPLKLFRGVKKSIQEFLRKRKEENIEED
jgi:uncharacterized membrane protein